MQSLVQRLCWNTAGWSKPSGEKTEKGFPSDEGFGFEEWNFCLQDKVDGNVLGYTYRAPKRVGPSEPCQLIFFAIDPHARTRVVCGIYHEARLMNDQDYDRAFKVFQRKRIFQRRAAELAAVVPEWRGAKGVRHMQDALSERWIKWKCPAPKVQMFSTMPRLESIVKNNVPDRFNTFRYLDSLVRSPHVRAARAVDDQKRKELLEDAYYRNISADKKEIVPKHNKLSNQLSAWLETKGLHPVQEKRRIDVQFRRADQSYICELKVCFGNTRQAIRCALGQLFEYNFYPPRTPADNGLIVLDEKPTANDLAFVRKIRCSLELNIYVAWRSGRSFKSDDFRW
jgi:hypothetical protein